MKLTRARFMDYDKSAAQRVAAGAVFLDTRVPGWERMIDPLSLDITDGSKCVLGQLGGRLLATPVYQRMRDKLGIQPADSSTLGFNIPPELQATEEHYKIHASIYYELLNYHWMQEIQARLMHVTPPPPTEPDPPTPPIEEPEQHEEVCYA